MASAAGRALRRQASAIEPVARTETPLSEAIGVQLRKGSYECMICTEGIRHQTAVWSCSRNCFRVFHLYCIKKWAASEESGTGRSFRCPACQSTYETAPRSYTCFCGKATDPKPDGFLTPHSCGEVCGRKRTTSCPHPCTNPCHPGPCLDCKHKSPDTKCPCGQMNYNYGCGKPDPLRTCQSTCGKLLGCGVHRCTLGCHHGPCERCNETVTLPCKCGKSSKSSLPCGTKTWSCTAVCGTMQRCGVHKCKVECHDGNCPPCDNDPSQIFTCPCGKQPLTKTRAKCTDAIPTCGQICDKVLACGNHNCTEICHTGACPPCEQRVVARCPCGLSQSKIRCAEALHFKCNRHCKAKLSCGKHECSNVCCAHRTDASAVVEGGAHYCRRVCNRRLACGHHCTDLCHRGPCPPCFHVIGEELSCGCGAHVLEPPLPCGTQPPRCDLPCRRQPRCGHPPVNHKCHYGECPKCSHPTEKPCVGGHGAVQVMCHTAEDMVTCGRPCGKPLACGHACPRRCHKDACLDDKKKTCGQVCGQTLACSHKCQSKCHAKGCPPCATTLEVQCECGIQTLKLKCRDYLQLAQSRKAKLDERERQAAENDDDNNGGDAEPSESNNNLRVVLAPCDDNCAHERRLAALAALGPGANGGKKASSGSSSGGVKNVFSIRAWQLAQKNLDGVCAVERHLEDFIRSQEKTKVLPPMQREKRTIVHEVAQFYHVNSEAVDKEPNRTCVLTRTPMTRFPPSKLSEAVYDQQCSPMKLVENVFSKGSPMNHVLVFESSTLSEQGLNKLLKPVMGQYVLASPDDYAECGVPTPKVVASTNKSNKEPVYALLAAFIRPTDAAAAFSMLRRNGCPVTFHRFGEAPPPRNAVSDDVDPSANGGALPATLFVDPISMGASSATAASPALPSRKVGAWGAPPPSSPGQATDASKSWASKLGGSGGQPPQQQQQHRETQRQRENRGKGQVETKNAFSALGK